MVVYGLTRDRTNREFHVLYDIFLWSAIYVADGDRPVYLWIAEDEKNAAAERGEAVYLRYFGGGGARIALLLYIIIYINIIFMHIIMPPPWRFSAPETGLGSKRRKLYETSSPK